MQLLPMIEVLLKIMYNSIYPSPKFTQLFHFLGKEADAIGILLRAVIMDQENNEIRTRLAEFMKEPEGINRLLSQVF